MGQLILQNPHVSRGGASVHLDCALVAGGSATPADASLLAAGTPVMLQFKHIFVCRHVK